MLFPDLLKLQGLKIALMDETGSEMLQPVGKLKTDIKASPHISSAADMGTEWSCLFKVELHLKSEFLLVGSLPLKPITEFLFFFFWEGTQVLIIFIGTHSHIPCLGRGDVLGIAPPFPQPPGTHCRTAHTGEPAMASLKPYPRWRHWGIALIRRTSCGRTVLDPRHL